MSRLLASRSLCDGLSTVAFIAALAHMKLANVAAVLQIAPLIITALSVVLYREVVGWRRWTRDRRRASSAPCSSIKPIPSEFNIWAVVAAASALAAAMREIQTRQIGQSGAGHRGRVLGRRSASRCAARLSSRSRIGACSPARDFFQLFVAAAFVGIAIYLLALGFRDVDLSVVAPFRYSYLLTSALGGYLVFREVPDVWTVVGAVLIVGSGIYTLHREAVRRRSLTATATPAA